MDQKVILQTPPPECNQLPSPKFERSPDAAIEIQDQSEGHESFFNFKVEIVDSDADKASEANEEEKR